MKLWRLYCNQPHLFGPIQFNDGLNVIYAKVTKPKNKDQDSHNLGKTLLIELIDFMLLKTLRKGHFLKDQARHFTDFVFFLEIKTNAGHYITVKRAPSKATKISLLFSHESQPNALELSDERWHWLDQPLEKARVLLDDALDLAALDNWSFRKGVGYFLRTQNDYRDVFQLVKFSLGTDSVWKPFMAALLGLPHQVIEKKYALEEQLKKQVSLRKELQKNFEADVDEQGRLTSMIEIRKSEVFEARSQVNRFNFYLQDLEFNRQLVEQIEQDVARLNERLYVIEFEIGKIQVALESKSHFDLNRVKRLFEEAELYFPEQLRKNYEQLVDFQRRMTNERNGNLSAQQEQLLAEQVQVKDSLKELNSKREDMLSVLQDTDTFSKFRRLQTNLSQKEADIARLEAKLENVNSLAAMDHQIEALEAKVREQVTQIQEQIQRPNPVFSRLKQEFNRIIRRTLNLNGFVYVEVNKAGNLEFKVSLLGEDERETAEDKGTSYKQLLCSSFDIALLLAYRDQSFYRFVYHDGVFERLDHRKKQCLLEEIRELCEDHGIQYILTIIDADMPRDANDQRVEFQERDIILALHEEDEAGRLFRMPIF